jgi:hypothetical protein
LQSESAIALDTAALEMAAIETPGLNAAVYRGMLDHFASELAD